MSLSAQAPGENLPLRYTSEDFFMVLGHISVLFATWDLFATLLLLRLMSSPSSATRLSDATLGRKISILGALGPEEVVDPSLLGEVHQFLSTARETAEMRNRFIHDQWLFDAVNVEKGIITRHSLRTGLGVDGRGVLLEPAAPSHISEFDELVGKLGECQKVFFGWVKQLE
ncbi:MAG: hypothetical protein KJZ79_01475 [Bryobacteraceae bacterium]|nr:hypothetical protein [Bryobacteraceae bacterium]